MSAFQAGLLIVAGLAVFAPNLNAYFLADDFVLLSWSGASSPEQVLAFFDPNTSWFYRPMVRLYYWAGQSLFGLRAGPFHGFSMLLHAANAYLVYRLVVALWHSHMQGQREPGARVQRAWDSELGSGRWAGLAGAVIFLLNPHHAETVSWVAAVADLLGALCTLGAMMLFVRFLRSGGLVRLVGSGVLFAVGLLTRETAALLPVLALLYAGVFYRRAVVGRMAGAFAVYGAMLVAYAGVQMAGRPPGVGAVARGGLQFHPLHLDSILLGILDYVHGLVPGGHLLAQQSLDVLRVLVWVEWAVLALAALALWKAGQRVVLFGLGWLLVSPLVFVFFTPPTDRYFYLPSVGYAILAAGLLAGVLEASLNRHRDGAVKAAVAGLAAVLVVWQGVALAGRVGQWQAVGHASGGVLHDIKQAVPHPPDHAAFYFVDLPPFIDGVPAFQNALPYAVQLAYGNPTLSARSVTCEQLQQVPPEPHSYIFRFKGDGVTRLTDRTQCLPR